MTVMHEGAMVSAEPTLFGVYVDGLEHKHLLESADIDAPTLRGDLVLLLC